MLNLYSNHNIQFIYDLYRIKELDSDINSIYNIKYMIINNIKDNSSIFFNTRYLDGSINKNKLSGNFNITYDLQLILINYLLKILIIKFYL